jgi:glycosyltransferase involved in cell wall biosynthesis
MKIGVVTLTHNEQDMLPWFLRHYENIADEIVIFDNASTDLTLSIAANNQKVTILHYNTGGLLDDGKHREIKNTYYKTRPDWDVSIIVDIDEFVYSYGLSVREYLEQCAKEYVNIPCLEGWDMVGSGFPDIAKVSEQLYEIANRGVQCSTYSKYAVIFKGIEVNYGAGAHPHDTKFFGDNIKFSNTAHLKLLHYKFLDINKATAKIIHTKTHLSENNIANKWATGRTVQQELEYYTQIKNLAIDFLSREKKELLYAIPKKKSNKKADKPIYGFMHICMVNNWWDIVSLQELKIRNSGLLDHTKKIYLSLVGHTEEKLPFGSEFLSKCEVIYKHPDITKYEFPALEALQNKCAQEDCKVWYIHTKGVARQNILNNAWRNFMEYFILEHWHMCEYALRDHDVAGILWLENWGLTFRNIFAGNFWWANSSYIKTLRAVSSLDKSNRFEAEDWIGKNNPRVGIAKFYMSSYPFNTLDQVPRENYPVLPGNLPEEYFDEEYYLLNNPDVLKAVQEKRILSGYAHYMSSGFVENRKLRWKSASEVLSQPEVPEIIIPDDTTSVVYGYIYMNQKSSGKLREHWKADLNAIIQELKTSGLYARTAKIFFIILGEKIVICEGAEVLRNTNTELYLYPALKRMQEKSVNCDKVYFIQNARDIENWQEKINEGFISSKSWFVTSKYIATLKPVSSLNWYSPEDANTWILGKGE